MHSQEANHVHTTQPASSSSSSSSSLSPSSTSTSFSSSSSSLSYFASRPWLDEFVSGMLSGFAATVALHPFDVIKTRLQVQHAQADAFTQWTKQHTTSNHVHTQMPHSSPSPAPAHALTSVSPPLPNRPYRSSVDVLLRMVREEGTLSLWRGLSPNAIGSTFAWGLYFMGYKQMKNVFQQRTDVLGAHHHIAAAAVTGIAVQVVSNPIWVVKTRMFLDSSPTSHSHSLRDSSLGVVASTEHSYPHYRGLFSGLRELYRTEGLRGYYRGFLPSLVGVSHGALQFMAYEHLKSMLNTRKRPASQHNSSTNDKAQFSSSETVAMAALSKCFAAVVTYPYQVIRSRMQGVAFAGAEVDSWSTVTDTLRRTWRNEGIPGFYRGLLVNLFKVTPSAMIVFLVYEKTNFTLKEWARQSQTEKTAISTS